MATTLSQVLAEARVLVTRLHDREKLADSAVTQGQALNDKISCMKEYQEDLHELNDTCHQHKPRSLLVHSLQQENRQIRQLQNDNRQLKVALEEHQQVLELLMQRHRQLMLKVMQLSQLHDLAEKAMDASMEATSETLSESSRVYDLSRAVDECLRLGEAASNKDQEELARLRAENNTLRQLLNIAAPNDPKAVADFAAAVAQQRLDSQCRPCTSTVVSDSVAVAAPPSVPSSSSSAAASASSPAPKVNGTEKTSAERRRLSVEEREKPWMNGNNNDKKTTTTTGGVVNVKRATSLDKPLVNGLSPKTASRVQPSTVPVRPALSLSKRKSSTDSKPPLVAPSSPSTAVKQKTNGVKAVKT